MIFNKTFPIYKMGGCQRKKIFARDGFKSIIADVKMEYIFALLPRYDCVYIVWKLTQCNIGVFFLFFFCDFCSLDKCL